MPFCLSICPYCDFVVYGGRLARRGAGAIERTIDALVTEIGLRADDHDRSFGAARPPLQSVYLGGGTPSLLSGGEVGRLLDEVGRRFGLAPDAEVTLEANPAPADRGDLPGFRAAGVNRLSFGAQSLNDDELRSVGRRHRAADVYTAVGDARAAGFEDVSLDLLYDLPNQTLGSWTATLQAAVDLQPDHLSVYALDLAHGDADGQTGGDHQPLRPGARRWRERARTSQDEDRAAVQYELAEERLARAGFRRYELSNWARPGRESRHNLTYWSGDAWEAVGPGAHAYDGALTRRWNAAALAPYLDALLHDRPTLPPGGSERLPASKRPTERALLGLRLDRGLPPALARHPDVAPVLVWAESNGLVERLPSDGARLTARGRLLSNEVFARLV